jgi:hypothetical protein
MTERKPPGVPPETWVDRQIREAAERGAFDDLPGAGKPIPGLDRPFTAERWAVDWVQREGGDLAALLPPLLALRKERAELLGSLEQMHSETVLRAVVDDFNRRLLDQYRRPADGPLVAVGVLDPESTVQLWREARARVVPEPVVVEEPVRRRRWFRRRRAAGWPASGVR